MSTVPGVVVVVALVICVVSVPGTRLFLAACLAAGALVAAVVALMAWGTSDAAPLAAVSIGCAIGAAGLFEWQRRWPPHQG